MNNMNPSAGQFSGSEVAPFRSGSLSVASCDGGFVRYMQCFFVL
jgi:hypothetical protein